MEALRTFDLGQGGVDRSGEARIVQLDGEVVALGVLGGLLPGRTQLDVGRVDAEVRPLSEGFSTRISLALTLRLSVLIAPEKPLPVEVNVPMVAIVSFPWFARAAPIATSMAVVRPEAIDLHPQGRNEMKGGRQRLSWTARNGAQRQGKKVEDGRCGDKIESPRRGSAFGQTSL